MMVILILVFSFFFEGTFSLLVPTDSLLIPLFTLVSLILIYPYFNKKNNNYYKYCFITGLIYDLTYTDTIIFNAFLFTLIGFIIVKLSNLLAHNYVNDIIMTIIVIAVYRIITYIFLLITGNVNFQINDLFSNFYQSLISNIIFVLVVLGITNLISNKLKIKRSL